MGSGGPSLTNKVVRAVSRETGTEPLELPSLYRALDGHSIEELVSELDEGQELIFNYAGLRVTVTNCGSIQITDDATMNSGNLDCIAESLGD